MLISSCKTSTNQKKKRKAKWNERQLISPRVLTNFLSLTPPWVYKRGLVKTLIDRTFKINNTWLGFHDDKFVCYFAQESLSRARHVTLPLRHESSRKEPHSTFNRCRTARVARAGTILKWFIIIMLYPEIFQQKLRERKNEVIGLNN